MLGSIRSSGRDDLNSLVYTTFALVVVGLLGPPGCEREVRAEHPRENAAATERLGADTTEMVRETTKAGGEYLDDAVITAQVKAGLMKDPGTSALAIGVETLKGTVQLSGFVDSADEKRRAEEIARTVDGVIAVQNALSVK